MSKFKPVSFQSVNEFLDYLPPAELKLVVCLRNLVLECIPDAKEKLSYNVPYYSRHSRICFIWPGSIPWGKVPEGGVMLGFCKGHLFADISYLDEGNRKSVFSKTFFHTKEINSDMVRQLLFEAVVIDEEKTK